jgi:hypothetical protein
MRPRIAAPMLVVTLILSLLTLLVATDSDGSA